MADRTDGCLSVLARLPRLLLGVFPTPFHRSEALGAVLGTELLWLKRDDLTGYAWGGNKVRATEFLLGDALARGATDVVLASGPSSNFAAILAVAAAASGLGVHQAAYGVEPARSPSALAAARGAGASVTFTGSSDRDSMEIVAGEVAAMLAAAGRLPYLIPRGGASPVGALGYLAGAFELVAQVDAVAATDQRIDLVVPLGSGGSTAGLLAGLSVAGVPWVVHAMSVSRPPDDIEQLVVDTAARCAGLVGVTVDPGVIAGRLRLVDARGAGFAATTPDEDAIAERVAAAGLLVDPTYNAKALLAASRAALGAAPVIYLATGGALGAIDHLRFRVTGAAPPSHSTTA